MNMTNIYSGRYLWQVTALQRRVESLERQLETKERRWSERVTSLQKSLERFKKFALAAGKCHQMVLERRAVVPLLPYPIQVG